MRTGSAWRYLPHDLPPWHSVYEQSMRWLGAGCFENLVADVRALLRKAPEQSTRRAKKGAQDECRGPTPTDRGKQGVKKRLLVDANGGPLAVVVAGANVNAMQLLAVTLNAIVMERPQPREERPQHLCLDKGYDNQTGEQAALEAGDIPHIRRIGEEKLDENKDKRHLARRWVVERTFGWLNRCRGILVRYEKKADNYLALVKVACALLWFRRWHNLSEQANAKVLR